MAFQKGKTVYTIAQALDRASKYCALEDRCQFDVRNKLIYWGLNEQEADEALVWLITEGFVNDERFARAFVRGKFKQNGWGKTKIAQALKAKEISDPCIQLGLSEVNQTEYIELLNTLASKKWNQLSDDRFKKVQKTVRFLLSRGFESALVWEVTNNLKDGKSRTV